MTKLDYIDSTEKLENAYHELKNEDILGIDLECENNLHHYGTYIALIQISSRTKNYIVDVLQTEDIGRLLYLLEKKDIIKIFHDINFDFRILNHQFECVPKNVFDTQIAAQFLGKIKLGLDALLEEYFQVKKQKKFQMADWTKRPLTNDMLEYAIGDTTKLIQLKAILEKELEKVNRLTWVQEECKKLETQKWEHKELSYTDVKHIKTYTPAELSIIKELFRTRKYLAKKVNRPIHYIISTKKICEIAKQPPKSAKEIEKYQRVHGIFKRKAKIIYEKIMDAKKKKVFPPTKEKTAKRFNEKEKHLIHELTELRDHIAKELTLPKQRVLTKDEIQQIIIHKDISILHSWQKELMESRIVHHKDLNILSPKK